MAATKGCINKGMDLSVGVNGDHVAEDGGEVETVFTGFTDFASKNFMGGIPVHFSRKDIKHQLLKQTPDADKRTSLAVWRLILKFMGDVTDYKGSVSNSHKPSGGSVMKRLNYHFGYTKNNGTNTNSRNSIEDLDSNKESPDVRLVEALEKSLNGHKKKSGGTMRKLAANLTLRLSRERDNMAAYDLTPLEDVAKTTLDQIHFIIGCGILKTSLRDEIYCQVCKQLTKNPYKSSIAKGWLLLTLMAASFPPSPQVLHIVAKFLEAGPPSFAVNCKKNLQRTLQNGSRNQPPSFMEYEAVGSKKQLELGVTLMDGSSHAYLADHATTAREVTSDITDILGIKEAFGFSLFISIGSKVASLGNGGDKVFDAISQCEQVYREIDTKDGPAPWRLFFRKEVQIAQLAAQQYYIEYGADISEEGLTALLPSYVPKATIADDDNFLKIRKLVVRIHRKIFGENCEKSPERVKQEVVHFAKTKWPLSFSRHYDVRRLEGSDWPAELALAINWKGVYVMSQGEILQELLYPEIVSVTDGGDAHYTVMLMLVQGGAIKLISTDAEDIRQLLLYILKGLKRRSLYAVAAQSYESSVPGEVSLKAGDLVLLDSMAQDFYNTEEQRSKGTNTRTSQHGLLFTEHVYVLPVLEKPSEDILNLFKSGRIKAA